MLQLALGIFLVAHGLIHLGYVTPAPADPNYPFRLNQSWLITKIGLDEASVRFIGIVMSLVTMIGFALTGLAAGGVIIPQTWGPPLALVSSFTSLILLFLFWHTWLVLGAAIDITLLFALLRLGWQPFGMSGV